MNPRQLAALTDPFTDTRDATPLQRHTHHVAAGDGAMLIVVLAIDR